MHHADIVSIVVEGSDLASVWESGLFGDGKGVKIGSDK